MADDFLDMQFPTRLLGRRVRYHAQLDSTSSHILRFAQDPARPGWTPIVPNDRWADPKDDRGVVYVETKGYKQDGTVVCVFRRKVMVPKRSYGEARGGEQPGRPVPGAAR